MSKSISPNYREILSARSTITGQQEYLTSTSGVLNINGSIGGSPLPISGALTGVGVAILDTSGNQISSFGGGTQYVQGVTTSPATGTVALGRYNSTLPTLTDGQLSTPQLDTRGGLQVVVTDKDGTGGAVVGSQATNLVTNINGLQTRSTIYGQFDDVSPGALTEDRLGIQRMSANRNAYTTIRDAAGNERGVNVTAGNALVIDGSASTQPISGTVAATQSGTWNIATVTAITAITNALPAGSNVIGHVITDTGSTTAVTGSVTVAQGTAANLNATVVGTGTFVTQSTLAAETTKVIGVVRNADGSGNLLTSTGNTLDVNLKTSSITLPVSLTSTTITGTVAVTQSTTPWVISGGGTAGSAATGVVTIQGIASMTPVQVSQATASNLNATVVGTGTFVVQATLAAETTKVIGTVNQGTSPWVTSNATTSVVGNGAAATAQRVTLANDSTGVIATVAAVTAITNALPTGTNSIGKISDITTSVVPGTGATNLGKAEDAAHASGDTGVFALTVRNDNLAITYGADQDYNVLATDKNGRVMVAQKAATGTLTNVAASATSVTVLAANSARIGATITNDSSAVVYLKFGATASTTSYTVVLAGAASAPFSYYEVPAGYTGIIDGISASATGNYRVTEIA